MKRLIKNLTLVITFCSIIAAFATVAHFVRRVNDPEARLKKLLVNDNKITKVFFTPDDDVKSILIDLIYSEKKKIITAIYTITDKDITKAFLNALDRGVNIEFVVDRGYGADKYSKVPQLANAKIPVWVYQCGECDDRNGSLMHDKFCVFFDNILNKSIIWTGSYNFTVRASTRNQENVIILDQDSIIQKFENQFEILKTRSLLISGKSIPVSRPRSSQEVYSVWQYIKRWFGDLFTY